MQRKQVTVEILYTSCIFMLGLITLYVKNMFENSTTTQSVMSQQASNEESSEPSS